MFRTTVLNTSLKKTDIASVPGNDDSKVIQPTVERFKLITFLEINPIAIPKRVMEEVKSLFFLKV